MDWLHGAAALANPVMALNPANLGAADKLGLSGAGNALSGAWDFATGQNAQVREDRRQQQQLLASLQAQAAGRISPADMAFQRNSQAALAQQYALGASQPGIAPAQAARMSQTGAANVSQGLAGQYAQMRAQEQLAAQQQLAQYLASIYGIDKGQANQNVQTAGKLLNFGAQAFAAGI